MYPFYKNFADKPMATTMLNWLEETLNNTTSDFFLFSHVYPANNWYKDYEIFWEPVYKDRLD